MADKVGDNRNSARRYYIEANDDSSEDEVESNSNESELGLEVVNITVHKTIGSDKHVQMANTAVVMECESDNDESADDESSSDRDRDDNDIEFEYASGNLYLHNDGGCRSMLTDDHNAVLSADMASIGNSPGSPDLQDAPEPHGVVDWELGYHDSGVIVGARAAPPDEEDSEQEATNDNSDRDLDDENGEEFSDSNDESDGNSDDEYFDALDDNDDLEEEFIGEFVQQDSILDLQNPDRPLYPGCAVSTGQAFLAVINFILRHSLDNACVENFLKLMDMLWPASELPNTRYLLFKHLRLGSDICKVHLFCERCLYYIGEFSGTAEEKQCSGCGNSIDTEQTFKSGCFFLCLGVELQLQELLPRFENELIRKSDQLRNPNLVSLLNGRMMREYYDSGSITDEDITLLFNCDGAPVFKTSDRSIWPVQMTVNEIADSPKDNKILAGLWFYSEKPPNHTIFKPFVKEMKKLGTVGFTWGERHRSSRAFVVCCTSDACARPLMRVGTQFNGEHGCDFCCQEGEVIERGNGTSRIYRYEPNAPLRTLQSFNTDALGGTDDRPRQGLRGMSELVFLPKFHMVRGMVPDYLHCVCYGVMRMLFNLWFNTSSHGEDYYLGPKIPQINSRLRTLRPPSEIKRVSKSVTNRRRWKANEYRTFLLFYSLVVLEGILGARYYAHLYLLVFAMHTLTQTSVSLGSVTKAERALIKFVQDIPALYSADYCTFNVHQLLHVANAVRDWGPFHLTSTFRFESNIGLLVKLVKGTKCVPMQICRTFVLNSYIPRLIDVHFPADCRWKSFMKRLNTSGHYVRKHRTSVNNVELYGAPTSRKLNNSELFALFFLFGENTRNASRSYDFYRALATESLYLSTEESDKNARHCDYVAIDNSGTKQIIVSCCVGKFECACSPEDCECEEDVLVFVRPLNVRQTQLFSRRHFDRGETFHQLVTSSDILYCQYANQIVRKCFFAKRNRRFCISALPNTNDVY